MKVNASYIAEHSGLLQNGVYTQYMVWISAISQSYLVKLPDFAAARVCCNQPACEARRFFHDAASSEALKLYTGFMISMTSTDS